MTEPTLGTVYSMDRQIFRLFDEIEDALENAREIIARRGIKHSSLCWMPVVRSTEEQLNKVYLTIYGSEVSFRNPEQTEEIEE